MSFDIVPYVLPFFASCIVNGALAFYGFTHRRLRGSMELAASSLLAAIWTFVNGMELTRAELPSTLFWSNFRYIGYSFAPLCWLFLVLRFNGHVKYIRLRTILVLSSLPAILCVLPWFDTTLGLIRRSITLRFDGRVPYLSYRLGPLFSILYAYSYGIIFTVLGFLIATTSYQGSQFKRRSGYFSLAFGCYFVSLFAYTTGVASIKHHDYTSIIYGLSVALLWWGISRKRIFRIPSIARSAVFEQMADGILVVDAGWVLLDSNESARAIFGLREPGPLGENLREVLSELASVTDASLEGIARRELVVETTRAGERRFIELDVSRLIDPRYEASWVILAKDVTELKLARERIMLQREELAIAAERDRLSGELHDTLGQVLSFAVIQTDTARREMGKTNYERADSYLARLQEILRDTHEDLRSFVRGLRAAVYRTSSFAELLEKEAERFRQSCDAEVAVSVTPRDVDLSVDEKNQLMGIVKEALNNVAKYAGASSVVIDFVALSEGNRLTIEDDGVGLATPSCDSASGAAAAAVPAAAAGSGLRIMSERAIRLGGRLSVGQGEAGGTRLVVLWPMRVEAAVDETDG